LGLGLFLWSSEDWMQKKDRNQRRPGRRRAEDVAWRVTQCPLLFHFPIDFGELHTAMQQQNREARACRRAPVPGPAASRPPLAITVERERGSSIISTASSSKMTDERRQPLGGVPEVQSTKQTLRESGDQPLVRSTSGRSTGQQPLVSCDDWSTRCRLQQQIV